MHAWAAIVMFVGASLGFVGLISLGVAALITSMGAEVIDRPVPYLVVGFPAVFVGGLLIGASFKFGFRRYPWLRIAMARASATERDKYRPPLPPFHPCRVAGRTTGGPNDALTGSSAVRRYTRGGGRCAAAALIRRRLR